MRLNLCCAFSSAAAWLLFLCGPAYAIVFYDTADSTLNTTEPTGAYANSGWQYQGIYGEGHLGTMIGEQFFITADHIGTAPNPTFTTLASNVTHTIDTAANGGQGFWLIPGTDLRIYKINGTFSDYAPLYTGSDEHGKELVVFGRGGPRGAEVELNGTLKGWLHTDPDGQTRWGTNQVSSVLTQGTAQYLRASFDAMPGTLEATLSAGDSGGAVFINDNGVWKLAGINFAVDRFFDTNNIPGDGTEISAALFDRGGFYQGSDGGGWSETPLPEGSPAGFYATRISAYTDQIQAIVAVPEPGAAFLLVLTASVSLIRRRRVTS